jgi:hypothetical protein
VSNLLLYAIPAFLLSLWLERRVVPSQNRHPAQQLTLRAAHFARRISRGTFRLRIWGELREERVSREH